MCREALIAVARATRKSTIVRSVDQYLLADPAPILSPNGRVCVRIAPKVNLVEFDPLLARPRSTNMATW